MPHPVRTLAGCGGLEPDMRVRTFADLAQLAASSNASDLFLAERRPVFGVVDKELRVLAREISARDFSTIVTEAFRGDGVFAALARREECDFTAHDPASGLRFRVNVALADGRPFAVFRRLREIEADPSALGVPEAFLEAVEGAPYGLILVIGTTGSGKSTTLAATLAWLLARRGCVVVTVEDPIEYLIPQGKGLVFQREVGRDTLSFAQGLRAAMRERPNVILVGEIRDRETALAALAAAETGHLVLSTLHAKDTAVVADRICGMFPPEEARAVRLRLTEALVAVLAQTLVRGTSGRVLLAWELLEMTDELRGYMAEGNRSALRRALCAGRRRLADQLARLVATGELSPEAARSYANDVEELRSVLAS